MSTPKAPAHLSPAARRLYGQIVADYVLEPHSIAVLVKSLEAFGRADQARDEIGAGPLMVESRLGEPKPHPLLAVEREARAQFFQGLKQLGLDLDQRVGASTRRR